MKFLLSVAAIIAVASAIPTKRSVVSPTAARPAILVDENNNPIAVGPDFVNGVDDFIVIDQPSVGPILAPIFPSPVVTPVAPVPPVSPVVPTPVASAPLVQLIVNVNAPAPVAAAPEPINIVDVTPVVDPVQIVDTPVIVDPVQIVDTPVVVEPVQIVDTPVVVEPVQIGAPIIPVPAVNLPEELN